jgi:hypothetical protein
MSINGIKKIEEKFSWKIIATERLNDYKVFKEHK